MIARFSMSQDVYLAIQFWSERVLFPFLHEYLPRVAINIPLYQNIRMRLKGYLNGNAYNMQKQQEDRLGK